jgi:hypothetical protein
MNRPNITIPPTTAIVLLADTKNGTSNPNTITVKHKNIRILANGANFIISWFLLLLLLNTNVTYKSINVNLFFI